MERIVLPELLDVLPPRAASALRSRRDLRRLNTWMGHPYVMARVLKENSPAAAPREIVELGAGDGHFLLRVAKRLRGHWPDANATLVDRLDALDPQTREQFQRLGWRAHVETADATEWLRSETGALKPAKTIISNLFFHQFEPEPLAEMLRLAANGSRLVVALEPRRAWVPRLSGSLLWAIGCGPVTRHDAGISVRAGFSGHELSALWPDKTNWQLTERPVGLFSHLFIARRMSAGMFSKCERSAAVSPTSRSTPANLKVSAPSRAAAGPPGHSRAPKTHFKNTT